MKLRKWVSKLGKIGILSKEKRILLTIDLLLEKLLLRIIIMYINKKLIFLNIESRGKRELLEYLCDKLEQAGTVASASEFFQAIWEREETFSTGIGRNVAIPHGKCACVKETKILVAILPKGVDYEALDGEPVNILFMFAVPLGRDKEYMSLLSKVTTFVRAESNRKKLLDAGNEQELFQQIREVIND